MDVGVGGVVSSGRSDSRRSLCSWAGVREERFGVAAIDQTLALFVPP